MQNQESALTSPKSNNFLNSKDPDRIWSLVYPDRVTFYLNDKEREKLLKELASGNEIIQIGSLTLSKRFTYLYQFKNKPSHREWTEAKNEDGSIVMREK